MNLENVYKMGLEKFAGDQQKAVEFIEGFAKEAGIWDSIKDNFATRTEGGKWTTNKDNISSFNLGDKKVGFMPSVMEGMGKGVGGALIAGGVGLIGAAASSLNRGSLHNKFMSALEQAIYSNPLLKTANRQKVVQYAESIFRFAPHVATDPNLLSSVLANAIHGEGIDPMTIKTLTDLEGRYQENNSVNPKTFI